MLIFLSLIWTLKSMGGGVTMVNHASYVFLLLLFVFCSCFLLRHKSACIWSTFSLRATFLYHTRVSHMLKMVACRTLHISFNWQHCWKKYFFSKFPLKIVHKNINIESTTSQNVKSNIEILRVLSYYHSKYPCYVHAYVIVPSYRPKNSPSETRAFYIISLCSVHRDWSRRADVIVYVWDSR